MKSLRLLGACLIAILFTAATLAQAPATTPPPAPTAQAGSKGSLVKIDGRLFVGLFSSGDNGAYPNRAFDVSDAKLRFTFVPSKDITVVTRLGYSKSATTFDYFYLDLNNWGGIAPGQLLRLGKQKVEFGEETLTDNPAENILITNSVASIGGNDVGAAFRGSITAIKAPTNYVLSVMNGTGDLGVAPQGLAVAAKLGASPIKNLYLSASVYDSGDMIKSDSTVVAPALKVANLQTVPTGATSWDRSLWEVNARWNYGPTGVKPNIPSGANQAPFQLGAALGQFKDDFSGEGITDHKGQYWYVEGLYNATEKIYLASRLSEVTLDDDATAKLADSPVAVNRYRRLSFGAGYHLSPLTDVKFEITKNSTDGGTSEPDLDQIAIGVATKF